MMVRRNVVPSSAGNEIGTKVVAPCGRPVPRGSFGKVTVRDTPSALMATWVGTA